MPITPDNKKTFTAIVILDDMINGSRQFKTVDNGDDRFLAPIFTDLRAKGYVVQNSDANYQMTSKGRGVYDTFMKRYTEYLKIYDVFSYVDLENGEFAFARYFDFETDEAWEDFTNDERFEDVRIAVAIFKKIDPTEIVFMSFINENHFDTTSNGWQQYLVSDEPWQEIEEIVNNAVTPGDIGFDAMVDMIGQGFDLMTQLLAEEIRREQDNNTYNYDTVVEEETVEYYQPYYDPYYVSPIWFLPLFLW